MPPLSERFAFRRPADNSSRTRTNTDASTTNPPPTVPSTSSSNNALARAVCIAPQISFSRIVPVRFSLKFPFTSITAHFITLHNGESVRSAWRKLWQGLILSALVVGVAQAQSGIQGLVAAGTIREMRWSDFRDVHPSVQEFYGTAYAPAWLAGGQPTPQAVAMIQIFADAWKKGLQPDDYDSSRWSARLQALQAIRDALVGLDVLRKERGGPTSRVGDCAGDGATVGIQRANVQSVSSSSANR
jgi:Scaffold domain